MFRIFIILGNLIALGMLLYEVGENMPKQAENVAIIFIVIFIICSNIFLLICSSERGSLSQWPFIIIKRKTLEEQKKIRELEDEAVDNLKQNNP